MKKLILLSFMTITAICSAQTIKIDSINFIKPGIEEVLLDASITNTLEPFTDKDDAVIYIYRLSSMAGAAVKWIVQVDKTSPVKIGQKEYIVAHINTTEKSHYVTYPDMRYNYINFKPNKYYIIRLKGFSLQTNYLNEEFLKEIQVCKKPKPKTE